MGAEKEVRTYLSLDRVPTLLTQIHKVQNTTLQMCQCRNTLHLDRIHLLQRVVQNPGRIDHLPPQVLVIEMADEERLGGERIGLDVDVGTGDFVDEGRFSDIRVAADEERAGVGVDGGQTGYVLPDLFEVG